MTGKLNLKEINMNAERIAKGQRNLEKAIKELEKARKNLCSLTMNKDAKDISEIPNMISAAKKAWKNADQYRKAYEETT